MTYISQQVDGLGPLPENDSYFAYEKRDAGYTFSVFPSRSTHRCQVKGFNGEWLEIVAWLLKTNTKTGATVVYPITQFGSHKWDELEHYYGPNMRKSQVHW